MFIGHAPASYLWTRWLISKWPNLLPSWKNRSLIFIGVFAGIAPDFDLLYFYFVDHRQHLHHGYWTHIPFFWLMVFTLTISIGLMWRKPEFVAANIIAATNIFLHLVLDTVVGKIRWLYPFSRHDFVWVEVPAAHHWWVWNFVLHWTFAVEIFLVVVAVFIAAKKSLLENEKESFR